MDLTLENKACTACAKAKRRCGKQIPTCSRCTSRGISCQYPPTGRFVHPPRQTKETHFPTVQPISTSPHALDCLDERDQTTLPWYLELSSWELDHLPPPPYNTPICTKILDDIIEHVQEWQIRWVNTASSPYIHRHVYKFQTPRCVMDAFTTLSTYNHRTPENKAIVLRLVEERICQLLADQPEVDEDDRSSTHSKLTVFEHLARVHALHIYQTIGLYDGAIRLRHVAEAQIPTMSSWLHQLLEAAKVAAARGSEKFVQSIIAPRDSGPASRFRPSDTAWYAWGFAETIRRTWFVCSCTQMVYLTLQMRWAPCPGGVMFTTCEGLWDADSAVEWESLCETLQNNRDGIDFVSRQQWDRIFDRRRPEDVDEFTTSTLDINFGSLVSC
ncbi:hypothetical protein M406DRAFT_245057 [Cryphonectria parasitica EP155]|uniref:Zn(2)-C6 fungal-type domain-containing protein n=1 Tax=Cryphonectria parasitica (strain ATCC 38755 / EP155) TaxID=660469 RepID=A0A9P5CSL4_CRYP1|nr:uncharacterized protein M406DRAFT_245057 [Cryphonectria parasitica EP155]KAF3769714.1 hypothetical protein M406DRAFT_245057 [Cryphonectria parasitica EP155]